MKAVRLFMALSALLSALNLIAVDATSTIILWPNGAPGALGKSDKDIPTLTPFFPKPDKATGAAMVICPGGAYFGLANHEGEHYARFLNEQGIAGFVLKYRLGSAGYRHPAMLQDAARAVRIVRARANEWKLDPKRVGIMGSSAGGHLASTLLTHFDSGKVDATDPVDRESCRPDVGILCYPVITLRDTPFAHAGSRKNLLGESPAPELLNELSNELHVTKDTPPCFIWHTDEDKGVLVENSLLFAQALRKAGVPFDLHIYEKGPHGLGLGTRDYNPAKWLPWTTDCVYWLQAHNFAKTASE
jgi:acetyl esterase/lipase